MAGAVIPDIDFAWRYLFKPQFNDHHLYLTHLLGFWSILLAGGVLWRRSNKTDPKPLLLLIFSLNGFIHILLDSINGVMYWLSPFSYRGFSGSAMLMRHAPEFVERFPYWHYALEATIIVWSILLLAGSRRKAMTGSAKDAPAEMQHPT